MSTVNKKESEKVVKDIESGMQNISSYGKEIEDSWEESNKSFNKSLGLVDKFKDSFQNVKENVKEITGLIAGTTWSVTFASAAKNAWDLNNSMTALSAQMGKGVAGVKQLEGTVTGMMKSIGTSYENAETIVKTFAEMKYEGDMTEAAKSVDMYSRATGVSLATSLQFTDQLSKQAGMSTKSTTALMAGMTNVQQKIGISKNGMEALSERIIDMSVNMAAFGRSSDEIKKAAVKTTALVGAMEKVGVAAQETLSLMDRITDPERIEDNILLYSQLGISMQDALSGNVEVTDDMLQQLGEKVKAMGPMAGSAFAQSMNMSYKDLVKMSNLTGDMTDKVAESAEVTEEAALGKLNELMDNAEGFGKKVSNFFNQLKGYLMGLGPILLTLGATLSVVFRKHKQEASVISDGIGETMGAGMQKGMKGIFTKGQAFFGNLKNSTGDSNGGFLYRFAKSGAKGSFENQKANREGHIARAMNLQSQYESLSEKDKISGKGVWLQKELRGMSKSAGFGKDETEFLDAIKNGAKAQRISNSHKTKLNKLQEKLVTATGDEAEGIRKKINAEKDHIKVLEDYTNSTLKLNKIQEKKISSESGRLKLIGQGLGSRISAGFGNWKDNIISQREEAGKSTHGFIGKAGTAKDMAKSALGGVVGKALKAGGLIAGAITFLSQALPGLKETLEPLVKTLGKTFIELLSKLTKALLPPTLKVLKGLLQITMPIVRFLSFLLSWIPGIGKAFKGIGETAKTLSGDKFLGELDNAAERISDSNTDLTKSIDKQTDVESGEGGAVISVSSGQAQFVSNSSSTSSDEANERIKNDIREQKRDNESAGQTKSLNTSNTLLEILIDEVKKLSSIIKNGNQIAPRDITSPNEV